MPRVTDIRDEIMQITGCSNEDAEIIRMMLIQRFGNIGGMKYSQFAHHAKYAWLLISLQYSKN
jgi:hypothetical protein